MKKQTIGILLILLCLLGCKKTAPQVRPQDVVTLKIGHAGHDHHLALFVALDHWKEFTDTGIAVKTVENHKFYELYEQGRKIADIEIVQVGGAARMPDALADGTIDVGFGGVASVIAAADNGLPVKLISPLHSKGDMFVLSPDNPVNTWSEFVKSAAALSTPLRIGYKESLAVAKLIFEDALTHEGITFSDDLTQMDVKIHLINVKGAGNLNPALSSGQIDGYVGNNPYPAIAAQQKIGKVICELNNLPPGNFKNHPCCCIGATTTAIRDKGRVITDVLVLCKQATEMINSDLDKSVESAVGWLQNSQEVEEKSIPTSGYSMEPSPHWKSAIELWIIAMRRQGLLAGNFKGLSPKEVCNRVFDLSLLQEAEKKIAQTRP